MRFSLAILLGSLALSYGDLYMDSSCVNKFEGVALKGLKGAYDLTQAALDVFNSPSTDPSIKSAQDSLVEDLFNATRGSSDHKKTVVDKFEAVLKYKTTSDGSPTGILDHNPWEPSPPHATKNTQDVIIFCDYDRFYDNNNPPTRHWDQLMQYCKLISYLLRK